MQARMEVRSYFGVAGSVLMATYIVGTPGKSVGWVRAMVRRTSRVSQRGSSTSLPPPIMARFMATVMP